MKRTPQEKLKTAVFVCASTKGGVGKTTTATQVLAPFLYNFINQKKDKARTPVRVLEVDAENNTTQSLSKTQIMSTRVIADTGDELQEIIVSEVLDLKRDYPVIIDIGVGFTDKTLKTLSYLLTSIDNLCFMVPTKQAEVDANNTESTIIALQELFPTAPIVLVLSDSQHERRSLREGAIEREFGRIFGSWKKDGEIISKSIFASCKIPQLYFMVPRDSVIHQAAYTSNCTVWEVSQQEVSLDEGASYRQAYDKAVASGDPVAQEEANLKNQAWVTRTAFVRKCKQYKETNLDPIFADLQKILFDNVLKA